MGTVPYTYTKPKRSGVDLPKADSPQSSTSGPAMPGLFDCTVNDCCLSLWCPCIASGMIIKPIIRETFPDRRVYRDNPVKVGCWVHFLLSGLTCVGGACYHGLCHAPKLRKKFNVKSDESRLKTCCLHLWCYPCALSQELGFIEARKLAGDPYAVCPGPQRQVMHPLTPGPS